MRPFMIPCDFGGRKVPFPIYVGEPKPDNHPLQNQSWWLSSVRGGAIPQDVMDSFEKLHTIAKEHNVSFEELCVYAMDEAAKSDALPEDLAMAAPLVGGEQEADMQTSAYDGGMGHSVQQPSFQPEPAYQPAAMPQEPLVKQRPLYPAVNGGND